MNPLMMTLLLVVALIPFARTMFKKYQLLAALESWSFKLEMKERLKQLLIIGIGQKRLIRRKRERASGWMHALIFWGFCVLLIRSLSLFGEGFQMGFHLPFLGPEFFSGYLYLLLKDLTEGIVLLMVLVAFWRRLVLKPKRLYNSWEALFVLGVIGGLMITDLLYDAARLNLVVLHHNPYQLHFFESTNLGNEFSWVPIASALAVLLKSMGTEVLWIFLLLSYWAHMVFLMVLLNFLPLGKHFHVITALPNVFLKQLNYPHQPAKLLDLENEVAWEDESLGLNHIHQLNWKQGLELATCTECGRCQDVCPAYVTEKPHNMKAFNDSLKKELFQGTDHIIRINALRKKKDSVRDETRKETIQEEIMSLQSPRTLVGEVISEDTLWSCTTCRACEEVCPVAIEHIPRITALRQGQTLMAEAYPKELNSAFKGLERNGNPWGIGYDKRADWAKGLNIKSLADDAEVEYLFWVGCAGSFDDRTKKVSVAIAKLLQKAGVNFGILGVEEKCTGDFARRVGNEMLYQLMALENIEVLNGYNVKKIITFCPHCLNTLKNEYPQMDGNYEVIHHSTFIRQLIDEGRLSVDAAFTEDLTYHDPCYLGRYNNTYQDPRSILNQVSKKGFTELSRHGEESFCCGAGGGRMWMEETIGKRINVERVDQIADSKVNAVAVSCPFCLTMIEDGIKETNREETIKTYDIAELTLEALKKD
jgi:Fe-S oxidoreductase